MKRRSFLAGLAGMSLITRPESVVGTIKKSASASGFYMPEEAEPHERTFMQWPVSRQVYRDKYFLRQVQETIAKVANTISEFEPVVMLMDRTHISDAKRLLGERVEVWDMPTDDLWCRDSGPVFVKNAKGELAVSQLNFNGWGNKQIHDNDGLIAQRVAAKLGLTVFDNGIVGEGGGMEGDGDGTLIAHESSWVNPNRNKGSKSDIGRKLLDALGAELIIWAPGIIGEDITDYHIDALARFTAPGEILIQLPDQVYQSDIWSKSALQTHDILAEALDARGRRLNIMVVPEPVKPRVKSPHFVASYVNYYVCNGAVIAAEFGDSETDDAAFETISKAYPNREVVMLNADVLGELGGGIHCATQQQPAYG